MTVLALESAINCCFVIRDAYDAATPLTCGTTVEFCFDDYDGSDLLYDAAEWAHWKCLCIILVYCTITILRG